MHNSCSISSTACIANVCQPKTKKRNFNRNIKNCNRTAYKQVIEFIYQINDLFISGSAPDTQSTHAAIWVDAQLDVIVHHLACGFRQRELVNMIGLHKSISLRQVYANTRSYLQQVLWQKLRPSKSNDRIQIFLHGVCFKTELMGEVSCDSNVSCQS